MLRLLRGPDHPLTASRYAAFLGRLLIFYGGVGLAGGLIALLAATVFALASPAAERPELALISGCPVALPDPHSNSHPISDCDVIEWAVILDWNAVRELPRAR